MKNKTGAVLFITLVILSIVVIVCAGITIMNGRDIFNIKRNRASTQAYFLAEAGIEESIQDLYDNKCNFNHFPKNKSIGNGFFSVSLDTTKYSSEMKIKIVSVGTVGDVFRTVSVTVKDKRIPAFTYAGLSNNYTVIYPGCTINGNFHSNSPSQAVSLLVTGLPNLQTTVNGNATACGRVTVGPYVTVTGIAQGNRPAVPMPTFNAAFWDYYYQLARRSGNVYNGLLRINRNLNPANGVIWVNGAVWLEGSFNFTGTIIATSHILVNAYSSGSITITPRENFPALMSKDSFIWVFNNTTVNGLFYAGSYMILLDFSKPLNVTANGVVMTGSFLMMYYTTLNYVNLSPPGLGSPLPLEVLCWG